ncbi:SpoIIIAH-like family protein [Ruminococcus flavefaciens]|uniref:SpoIIIAH-like family protein n=1 Tax=Ruminococcus flavefaciens TaxID=1265 RepID=UPI0003076BB4|nr:SpoIIIAH-like family protein [Ruminococcus flavefaciens]
MKKPTIIIGKKQIIMTCLTLMLAVAVYINYTASPKIAPDSSGNEFREDIKYGETEFVNAEAPLAADDYFAQARLDKLKDRDEAVQTLQTMIGGGDVTEDEMVVNALDAVEVSKLIESEGTIESLIKAQGFQDCVAYLDGKNAKIVVKTEGLDKAQAASIKDIILGETEVPAENIRIFEVK